MYFFHDTAPTAISTLSLHDALPIFPGRGAGAHPAAEGAGRRGHRGPGPRPGHGRRPRVSARTAPTRGRRRSEEHTSELQSLTNLVCRLLLEKKNKTR